MDHLTVSEINPDMGGIGGVGLEEDQVTLAQVTLGDIDAGVNLFAGGSRKFDLVLAVDMLHEAGTVDTRSSLPAEAIGGAEVLRRGLANGVKFVTANGNGGLGRRLYGCGERSRSGTCLPAREVAGSPQIRQKFSTARVPAPGDSAASPDKDRELCIISMRSSSAAACGAEAVFPSRGPSIASSRASKEDLPLPDCLALRIAEAVAGVIAPCKG